MRHCFPGPCLRPCYMGCPLDTLLTPAYQKFFCLVLSDVLCFIKYISTVAMNISNSFHSYCQHDIINCHCKYDTEVCATLRGCYIMFCVRVCERLASLSDEWPCWLLFSFMINTGNFVHVFKLLFCQSNAPSHFGDATRCKHWRCKHWVFSVTYLITGKKVI